MKKFLILFAFLFAVKAHAYQPAVVSANGEATKVGMDILKKGGSAIDAAIATAFALAVVEPYNSGLGGGGFLLYYSAKEKQFYFIDYREASPFLANLGEFKENPDHLEDGILSAATPGFVAGMFKAHKEWKKISWSKTLQPAIDLAKRGITITPSLRDKILKRKKVLEKDPEATRLFLDPVANKKQKIDMSDLANTLDSIRKHGKSFYDGDIGETIATYMKENGGLISAQDLGHYQVHFRKPYNFQYGQYDIYTAPQPSSGGEGLNLLFRRAVVYSLPKYNVQSPRGYQMIAESFKDYFTYRDVALGDTGSNIIAHTTHLAVMDKEGNIATMTNSLNFPFGSGVVIPGTGIILNNEMADFSLKNGSANKLRPGVRPLSSMSPTIILKKGEPYLVIGTPGGKTIPQNIFQVLLFHWDWKMSLTQALKRPKFYYSPFKGGKIIAEKKLPPRVVDALKANYPVSFEDEIGNMQILQIKSKSTTLTYSDERGEGRGLRGSYR